MPTRLSQRHAAIVGWTIAALAFLGGTVCGVAVWTGDLETTTGTAVDLYAFVVGGAVVGAVLVSRLPQNPIGWLFLVLGLEFVVSSPLELLTTQVWGTEPPHPWGASLLALIGDAFGAGGMYVPVVYLLLLFPTGRPLTPRWRVVGWLAGLQIAATLVTTSLADAEVPFIGGDNPFGVLPVEVRHVLNAGILGFILLAALSVVLRVRRSEGVERQQLRWFAASATFTAVTLATAIGLCAAFGEDAFAARGAWFLIGVILATVPVSVGIAIARYRLYDLDLVVSRTLAYGALTAVVLGVYAIAIVAAGRIAATADDGAALVAAALAAVVAAPLRDRLQRGINRALFGHRNEPLTALAALGERLAGTLAPEAVLPALVETVAQALRVPHVAVELREQGTWREEARHGEPAGEPLHVPLLWEGEAVGRLVVSPRSPSEPLDDRDRALLAQIARQAGSAVHGVQLARELQRYREQLVAAREEERRRIRRDLHDGLGPQLAAIGLQLRAAANVAGDETLSALARDLQRQVRGAIEDVRRLVDDLRPPQLDEYGLAGALRNHAARLRTQLDVEVDAPEVLQPLPAAVEVAAYRIATEALTNAARHAGARRCSVSLRVNGALELEVVDDGSGLPSRPRTGIGLGSMRDRAAELGGSCLIESRPSGGTRVVALLPLPAGAS